MTVGEKFLRRLFNDMELRYRVEREERRRMLEEKYGCPVVFVHELLECAQKREMRRRFPEVEAAGLYNPRFVVGWIVEEGIKALLGVREEQHYWEREVEVDGRRVVIAGGIDARDPETGRVLEIKYMSGLYGSPWEHHKLQLGIYCWGVGEEVGELWEISPKGVVFIEVPALSDGDVKGIVAEYLDGGRSPRWNWECDLCDFEPWCPLSVSKKRVKKGE